MAAILLDFIAKLSYKHIMPSRPQFPVRCYLGEAVFFYVNALSLRNMQRFWFV